MFLPSISVFFRKGKFFRETIAFSEIMWYNKYVVKRIQVNTQRYRSGHNGADSKSVCGKPHEGSNPSLCAKTKDRHRLSFCFAPKDGEKTVLQTVDFNGFFDIIKVYYTLLQKGIPNMKNTFPIAHYNHARGADELIIYNGSGTTGTNKYGSEACILNGRVISCGQNNNAIPEGGYVVSGHGKASKFISESLCIGAKAEIDEENMLFSAEIDDYAMQLKADAQIDIIRKRVAALEAEKAQYDSVKVASLLNDAENAKANGEYDLVSKLTDEAYYYTAKSIKGEVRAVWHRPRELNEEQVEATVKSLRDAGFNQILVETNYEGYANALKCVHDYLPVWKRYENGFDVIDAFIRIGKAYGMKIHAWFEDFFFGCENTGCPMLDIHPEWMARRKDGGLLHDAFDTFYFLNPALPEVREFLLGMCKELLDNYDFDGLQLDYIRYPINHSVDRSAGFEPQTREMFLNDTGIDINDIPDTKCDEWKKFVEWRASKVTMYVESVRNLILEYRANGRDIELSTAVFGDPDEAIRLKCQNWCYWVKQGWLDAIYPMAYLNDAVDVGNEVAYMVQNYGEAPNISGIAPMYHHLPTIESTKQVEECRRAGAKGVAFFCAGSCTEEQLEKLKLGVFREE